MGKSAPGAEQEVLGWIHRNRDWVVELLRRLVRIPSVYPEEGAAQEAVRAEMAPLCDRLDVWEPDRAALESHPAYFAPGRSFAGRPNVVGTLAGAGGGRSLLLNAHIDVVPPQPASEWKHGPWSADVADGRIHGRGTLDDKSGIAVMIAVARALRETGTRLAGDLQLHSVVDEEWGGAGTLAAVQRGHLADGGIVLEPVGPAICPASRGGQAFRVVVEGKGAHPGASWKGVSALEKAIPIIRELKALEAERNRKLRTPLFAEFPIFAPIVVGTISADNIPSKVPEQCVFQGLFGYTPEEHWREARRALEDCVLSAAARDPWLAAHPPRVSWPGLNKQGAGIPADHPLVSCLAGAVASVTGRTPHVAGFPAGTDLPLLVLHGPMPALLYGVACEMEDAHSSTESVGIDDLLETTRSVAAAAVRWCGLAS